MGDFKLLDPAAVADALGVKVSTLAKWRCTGKGPRYVRVGSGPRSPVRYRMADVVAWVDSRVEGGAQTDEGE